MLSRYLSALAATVFAICTSFAQVGVGTLQGVVKDKKSGELLAFVSIVVENKGTRVAGGSTDFDGNFKISPIEPGTYDVTVSYVGYQPMKQTGVVINSNKITFLNPELTSGVDLQEVEVVRYKVPLIDKDGGASGSTITREQIAKMPARTVNGVATQVAGASDAGTGGGVSIRGARSENTYYYIDGVKVPAGAGIGLPKSAIEEVQVITGGVPANYGDVTGGLVNITTRGPSRSFFGGVDMLSSGFKVGEDITDIVGLDKYAYNQVEASLSGPIFFKKDSAGNKVKPLLGFFLSGQLTDAVDDSPLYGGDLRVKRSVRDRLLADPLGLAVTGDGITALYNSDLLRGEDVESIPTRQNAGDRTYLGSIKFDIATTPTINLTVGGSIDYNRSQNYDRNNALLNAENNTQIRNLTYRGFVRFTQRFASREEETAPATDGATAKKKGGIRNAYYSLQMDYSKREQNVEDPTHQDRLFDYGYIGRYQRFLAPSYQFHGATSAQDSTYFQQTGNRDTLVTFVPGTLNPTISAITSQFFNLFPDENFPVPLLFGAQGFPGYVGYYEDFENIQTRRGLLNGQAPASIYSIWNNAGVLSNNFSKFEQQQIRVSATGAADIGKHAVSVGVEYEQLSTRSYDLAPVGLWTRARALTNFHIEEYESTPSGQSYFLGTLPYYSYDRSIGPDQAVFDRNLRESLGLNPDGNDYVQIDALDPSALNINMFSADEIINAGRGLISEAGGLISYYGYDHVGNKLTAKPSFEKFFSGSEIDGEDTLYSRLQAPFQPIYVAGYVMDKFSFDDIIFNVGVRVDRYDANQYQLKDKYLWRNAWTAGEAANSNDVGQGIRNQLSSRPSNIGEDYVVYVDNAKQPTSVVGYRDGDRWYNAAGEELVDPSVLRSAEGIQPYLIGYQTDQSGDLIGSPIRKDAFRVYDPVVNVMPRVAFSFPISDQAVFFAHYDVLTQRPTSNSRLDLLEYAYILNTGNILNNPALKPTKTIDYELGFQQVLSKASSLKISAFYRELRDQIQVRNVAQAWPSTYRTYDNLDFGTVKGFSLAYDLRRTGNVRMTASYTLQFADGTGSDPGASLSLINANQPNLRTISPLNFDQRHRFTVNTDFSYGGGTDYNGPRLFGTAFFQNMGVNFTSILGSGTPYSPSSLIVQEGNFNPPGGRLVGTINGARLPWLFTTDVQMYRDIPLTFGSDDGDNKAKKVNLNVYLLVSNVFNTGNITGVYRATGSPDDDGYLAAPQYQPNIDNQNDPQSFRELYALKVNNPFNLGAPRTIRLGLRFDF
ncbi:MAG: carboxypeptidase-like regulatory domain-containing protein [Flavobacteriales bacterium]|nr:carboxypeptidase-like regulatory domain-containing protein [Flavobacteriales bacterium]